MPTDEAQVVLWLGLNCFIMDCNNDFLLNDHLQGPYGHYRCPRQFQEYYIVEKSLARPRRLVPADFMDMAAGYLGSDLLLYMPDVTRLGG